jgi:hypothetical protein
MIHLYMIFYDDLTAASIPDGFIGLSNTNPRRKELFEVEPILKFISQTPIEDDEFYGFFSPRIFEKTGLEPSDFETLTKLDLRNFDIVSLAPAPLYLSSHLNPVAQADISHGDFTRRFELLISKVDQDCVLKTEEFARQKIDIAYFLLSHYFLARGGFWKTWAQHVEVALRAEADDDELRSLLNESCPYPGRPEGYQYLVFLLERLAGLIAFSQNARIYEAFLKKRCISEFEKSHPWPRCFARLTRPLFGFETRLRGDQSFPVAGFKVLAWICSSYTKADRFVATAVKSLTLRR